MSFLYFFYGLATRQNASKLPLPGIDALSNKPVCVLPIVELPDVQTGSTFVVTPTITPPNRELFPETYLKRVSYKRQRIKRVSYGFFHPKNRIKKKFIFRSQKINFRKKRSNFLYKEFPLVKTSVLTISAALNMLL